MAPVAVDVSTTPPRVVGPATKKATRPTNQLPQSMIDEARKVKKEAFDSKVHLNYKPPTRIYTMKEIGLEGHGISPNAASEPFSLFTEEAIRQMRAEIFSEEALNSCQYTSTFIKNMVRGMGPALAPFIYHAWNSPEVLAKVSAVAGVDLIPAIDFEIGNVNISFGDGTTATWDRGLDGDDGTSAVAWHYDSFPFVCVTMLSDCTGMVGGETALRRPDGHIMKVRGPAMGTSVVLQGRYIEHQALKALGGRERISMVTSFRPRSPMVKDETVLTGVRGISEPNALYSQYTDYRLELLEERLRIMLKEERRRQAANRPFDIPKIRRFLAEQKDFLDSMLEELIDVDD
ncbi:hypothetical protein BDV32DRAFT_148208 [Aspergillus pseudonomiae]|uniref:Uncharacterized protein n=1 Tax=Aspergillus pseudonomiae TaxID=1506151 RepID=A0A5N6I599_9EURO|nr:uncharacterized protein BDV37DRAFT_297712 [Aspergillus pseudonomiae]KAB8261885.1 hypothetical protein BDV32DRAFT_148208 [Aspergillus pseudonomiae]KAE8399508.1 hypothetical protein BDV37DRAFT_297712 [Aspergillus pseudonomiae]